MKAILREDRSHFIGEIDWGRKKGGVKATKSKKNY
jgi:hypothetical protein